MEKAARGKRARETQKEFLINFLENNVDISNDKFVTADGAKFSDSKWRELALSLNALGGTQKDGIRWKKYWSDLRINTKAKHGTIRQEEQRSGVNGLRRAKELSSLEERFIQITTVEAVDGDNTVEVGFDETTSPAPAASVYDKADFVDMTVHASTTLEQSVATTSFSAHAQTTASATTAAEPTNAKRTRKRRRIEDSSSEHVGNLFKIEEKKLKAMEVANELKRETIQVMKEQTAAIKEDAEIKRCLCYKLEEVIEVFKIYS